MPPFTVSLRVTKLHSSKLILHPPTHIHIRLKMHRTVKKRSRCLKMKYEYSKWATGNLCQTANIFETLLLCIPEFKMFPKICFLFSYKIKITNKNLKTIFSYWNIYELFTLKLLVQKWGTCTLKLCFTMVLN